MSDCEDFFLEYWMSPGKRKRENNLKENKTWVQHKRHITMKTDERIQKKKKKKKNSKFKEAMEEKKQKKKDRNKKKSSLELNDMQDFSGVSDPVAKPKASDPHSTHLTNNSEKRTKRKKKVTFDISPSYICAKHPKVISWSLKENSLPEIEAVTNISCCQVTKTQRSQAQSHDNDSQCTNDDINSQDLFITQKTFSKFHTERSSGEASDKEVDTPPQQTITQKEMVQHLSVVNVEHDDGSDTHLEDSHFHQRTKKVKEPLHIGKGAPIVLSQEVDFEQNFIEKRKAYGTVPVKPRVMKHLDDPVVVKCSMDVTKFCTSSQESPLRLTNRPSLALQTSTASISTQTENFFTAELSSYLSFCHKRRASLHLETLKPLDLSFPQRVREDLERHSTVKSEVKVNKENLSKHKASSLSEDAKRSIHKNPSLHSSTFSEQKGDELKPAVRQLWCKGQNAPSFHSESEPKSADTTSSEDNEPACHTGKLDLIQVRAIQMRLNESFFFKTKGDGQSPRPTSPLMKVVQSRETKKSKYH